MKHECRSSIAFCIPEVALPIRNDVSAVTTMKHECRMPLRAATKQQNGNSVFFFRQKGYVRNRMRSRHRRMEWDGNRIGRKC